MANTLSTGSYAVSNVYSISWTKKKTSVIKTRKKKSEKKVINPIFETCSKITTDHYWVAILKDCARGKCPRGFYYKNGLITHRRGNSINRVLIPKEPNEALSTILSFFKKYAGLISVTDKKKMQASDQKRFLESMSYKNLQWKDITTDKVKELLVSEYITELSNKANYSEDECKKFITVVKSALILKYFKSDNIKMVNGKITNMVGLIYNSDDKSYSIDPKYCKSSTRVIRDLGIEKEQIKPNVSFISLWNKYINSIANPKQCNFRVVDKSDSSSISGDLYSPNSTSSIDSL